jgi:hypothetical protein
MMIVFIFRFICVTVELNGSPHIVWNSFRVPIDREMVNRDANYEDSDAVKSVERERESMGNHFFVMSFEKPLINE